LGKEREFKKRPEKEKKRKNRKVVLGGYSAIEASFVGGSRKKQRKASGGSRAGQRGIRTGGGKRGQSFLSSKGGGVSPKREGEMKDQT